MLWTWTIGSPYHDFIVNFDYSVVGTSGNEGGSTTIKWELYLYPAFKSSYSINNDVTYSLLIDDKHGYGNTVYYGTSAKKSLESGTLVIPHNYVGSRKFNMKITLNSTHRNFPSSPNNQTRTHTFTLDFVKIASQVLCSTGNIGTAPTITINRQNSAYTDTLTYTFGSHGATILEKTSLTSYTGFTYPNTFYAEIPNAKYGIGAITCETYDGDTKIGESYTEFRANVNEASSTPTIFPTIKDTNSATVALTGDSNTFVRYMSIASVTIGAEARNYATLKSQICANGSKSFTTPSGTINGVEQAKFSFSTTDSRGYTTAVSMTKPFIEYILPTCNIASHNIEAAGNVLVECSGSYWNGNFGKTANTLTVQYRYKAAGGSYSSWTNMSASISGNTYNATANLSGLDYQTNYVFQTRAVDKLNTALSGEIDIISVPVFHWGADDFVFEVPVTFKQGASGIDGAGGGGGITDGKLDGDLNITGDLRLKGSGNYGNTLYFGDGSYCYLQEATDDALTIKATTLNLNATNVNLNGGALKAGTWTPALKTSAAVSSYTTQSGWYIRVGNVVTVGFNIAASCNSGYNSTALEISGLPFTPAYNAFGGGVMFGAYVNAGFCFEAWAATTSGTITPRLQPCNNTSAANLQIASTAYYPSGANSVTLGGTITYLIS